MRTGPRFLVAEGNTRKRCEETRRAGLRDGSECYRQSLMLLCPEASVDIIFASEPDTQLPTGAELKAYDGVVVGGSGLNLPGGETNPEIVRQVDFTKAVFEAGVPFFGSCWGLQIAAVAAGGKVAKSPRGRELNVARKLTLTPEGRGSLMYEGKALVFDSMAIHLDEVTHLPPGSVLLASNAHTTVQAAIITHNGGTFWGVQYHPEFDVPHLAGLIENYTHALIPEGFFDDLGSLKLYTSHLRELAENPERSDLRWLLGIDADVLDDRLRLHEVGNWITHQVYPAMIRKQ